MSQLQDESIAVVHPNKRQAAKMASREALMAAAIELMPVKGIDVSLDEICAKAGYTRGALYQHFPDREALLAAVVSAQGERMQNLLIGRFADLPEASVDGFLQILVDMLKAGEYPVGRTGFLKAHQLMEACERFPVVRDIYSRTFSRLFDLVVSKVETAKAASAVKADLETQATAVLILSLLAGMRTLHELDAPVDFGSLPDTVSRMLRRG